MIDDQNVEIIIGEGIANVISAETETVEVQVFDAPIEVVEISSSVTFQLPEQQTVESAETLAANFIAMEPISALSIVRLTDNSTVSIATNNGTEEQATAMGIALTGGGTGESIKVQFFGIVEDPFFNYPANASLYLSANGTLSLNIGNDGEYRVLVAQSLGTGIIFIRPEEPILI